MTPTPAILSKNFRLYLLHFIRFFLKYLCGIWIYQKREAHIMLFKKLSAPSLKELFVAELEGMILSGKLEIGAKLPA